nr:hypothetical protein [Sinorhizobium meliloti]
MDNPKNAQPAGHFCRLVAENPPAVAGDHQVFSGRLLPFVYDGLPAFLRIIPAMGHTSKACKLVDLLRDELTEFQMVHLNQPHQLHQLRRQSQRLRLF